MSAAATEWVLKAQDLRLGYPRKVLFERLSFEVTRGQILGVVGPNGCGKTTLLRTLLGLVEPLAGRVQRRAGLSVSYVPQRERIERVVPVTVREVVLMGPGARVPALHHIGSTERDAADRALTLLGIAPLAQRLFRQLSTGQQQRVLVARAIATDPDLLVLDEPTVGMDVASESAMIEFLRKLNRDRRVTVLIVTHLLPIVLNLVTDIMLMGARGILHGPIDEVVREDRLAALYGVPVRLGQVAGQRTLVIEQGRELHV